MAYNNFTEDVVFGEEGEKFITEYLENKGLKLINTNQDYKYDLKMLKNNFKAEVNPKVWEINQPNTREWACLV